MSVAQDMERLRRMARYGDDLGAALEVLRYSERAGWQDAPLLDFGDGDPERLADKLALGCLRGAGKRWGATIEYMGSDGLSGDMFSGTDDRPDQLYVERFTSETEGWFGHLWMLSLSKVRLVYTLGPIFLYQITRMPE